jgi:dienelactone hydrolase
MTPALHRAIAALALIAIGAPRAHPQTPASPRTVDIRAGDGSLLRATLWTASRAGPAAAVLLLHQCDDTRTVWNPLGARLAARGISALAIDYRGYGESGGTPHDKLSNDQQATVQRQQWPADIDTAFAFLARQQGVDRTRLGAAGGSCGVQNATQLAIRHADVKALALLAGGTDRAGRLFLASPKAPPTFTSAAADDQYADFVAIMGWYAAMSTHPSSRMATYTDGGHAAVMFAKHPALADTIARWFAVVLGTERGSLPKTNGVPMRAEHVRVLEEIDRPGGAAAAARRLAAQRASNPRGQPFFPEYFVNSLGYEHLAANDARGALEIMKLNVAAFPASPNAMDSLGDAYLAVRDSAAALDAARKTLDLLARDTIDTPQRKELIRQAAEGKITALATRPTKPH